MTNPESSTEFDLKMQREHEEGREAVAFLMELSKRGGRIVSSNECSVLEIAEARAACDNRWLCIDSLGFVRRGE